MKKAVFILIVFGFIFAFTGCNGNNGGADLTPQTHVFLAFGQSNMQGPGGIEDYDREGLCDRFLSMTVVGGLYGSGNAAVSQTRVQGQAYRANPPNILNWAYPQHNHLGVPIGLSPIDHFGRTLVANTPDHITIKVIAVAQGDLALAAFHPTRAAQYYFGPAGTGGMHREAGRPSPTERQGWQRYISAGYDSLYDALITNARLAQEQGGIIKGIIFHQGESGRGLNHTSWLHMLGEIYNSILRDLELPSHSIPILLGQMLHGRTGPEGILGNELAMMSVLPRARIIPTAGLEDRSDDIHFATSAIRELGRRYAYTMLELVY